MSKLAFAVAAALAALCVAGTARSDTPVPLAPLAPAPAAVETAGNETPNLWFVELGGAPIADGGRRASIRAEQRAFRGNAAAAGLSYRERYAYDTLFNGFSVEIDATQLGRLSRLPGVKAIYPVDTIGVPETEVQPRAELFTSLAMIGADIAHSELGLDGAGVKLAIMDTGIDIDHPAFGGNGAPGTTPFPTPRVVAGWDFVGDDFNADSTSPDFNPVPVPDPVPDDCNGHGTHVSGIAGANGAVVGVAPNVTFGAYRVFGCEGSTTGDIMIAAMERLLADGMQVLNMSIGSAFQWSQFPTAQAATRLVNQGVVVVASIGNSGANGLYSASAPGVGDKVIGVAAFNNTSVRLPFFTISPDDTRIGYSAATGAPPPPTAGTEPLARTGTAASTADACSALPAGSLSGHVALIRRGTCTFRTKALNAQAAGATGVALYNNVAGRITPTVAGDPPVAIPVVAISDAEGLLINARLATGPVDLTWTDQTDSFVNPLGGLISSFSSYGVTPDLQLKPDIGAPGGGIFSTFPLEQGSLGVLSGTSMSSPHVAGAAALMLQAQPNTSPQAMRTILQNSAQPKLWWGNPGLGFLDNVHRQGAGIAQIDKSVLATTRIEPGKLSLGESEAGPAVRSLTIRNVGNAAVSYDFSFVNALSTGFNTFTPSFSTSNASVAFDPASVTVPAGGQATVEATITAPSGPNGGLYGGYLVATSQADGHLLRVPFSGYVGDYQARQVLVPTANGFPWLAKRVGTSFVNQPGGASFSLEGDDVPFFVVHFDHPARRVRAEAFAAGTGKAWHRAFEREFQARNSGAATFFAFAWDGMTTSGGKTIVVPDGDYVVVLSVLKALGDAADPAHTETWTSPVIAIDRPD